MAIISKWVEGEGPVSRHMRLTSVCEDCEAKGRAHEIEDVAAGHTDRRSTWGPGLPAHKRRCTGCGFEDGPWIKADLVGGGY